MRQIRGLALTGIGLCTLMCPPALAQLSGELGAHDPSSVITDGSRHYYFATGPGIVSRSSTDLLNWSAGPSVFATPPAWTKQAVPGFTNIFWAPDVVFQNGQYHLYYSISTFGSQDSAIGLATSPTLNPAAPNYGWTDHGMVVESNVGSPYNTIDPSIFQDTGTGRTWMAFGSYWNGIYVTELNPSTGKRLAGSPDVRVAGNSSIEASALMKHDDLYYLFVNWGSCCVGVDSTYNIRVGRSTSPTGPFLDKNGVDMRNGGGSLFLDDDGRTFGPGHFEYLTQGGQEYFSYHYYDGDANGARTFGLRELYWTPDGWPSYAAVNPEWTGGASANWSNAANWTAGGVPNGVSHVATFRSHAAGRYNVALDGSGKTVSTINFRGVDGFTIGASNGHTLTLDAAAGDSATINVEDGNHAIAAPLVALDSLGVNVVPAGRTLTLSGPVSGTALSKYGYGTLSLAGANSYNGSISLRRGMLDVSGSLEAGGFASVGRSAGDNAAMTVRGSGSFSTTSDLNVGDTGDAATPATGTLTLRDSASITIHPSGGFYVGSGFFANTRATGTVHQSGGTLTVNGGFDGAFIIGGRHSSLATGTYNLSGGTVNANTNVRVGGHGAGSVNQTGGTFNATGHVAIGRYPQSTGAWTLRVGFVNHDAPSRLFIVGEEGDGTLTVSGGGQLSTNGTLRLGHAATGAGTVNLDLLGTITTPAISRGAGSATFNFNGGTLRAAVDSPQFMQGLTTANIKSGGAVIDSNGNDVVIPQPLIGTGGLRKSGAGTLTLSGLNAYTGATSVEAGTLRVSGTIAQSGSASVGGGARFEAASTQSLKRLNLSAAAIAVITPSGGRVLDLGDLSIAGSTDAWTARLDLSNNDLILHTTGGPARDAAYARTLNQLKSGLNEAAGAFWTGNGITSSTAAATGTPPGTLTAVGAILNDFFAAGLPPGPVYTDFAGRPTTTNDILLKYTWFGDADLSGVVDGTDYFLIDQAFAAGTLNGGWLNGDFNYSGNVDGTDYFLIDQAFNAQTGPLSSGISSPVPEPGTLSTLFIAAGLSLAIRRPRRS